MNKEKKELIYYNALNNILSLGPRRIAVLIEHSGSAEAAWKAPAARLAALPGMQNIIPRFDRERLNIDPFGLWDRLIEQSISCTAPHCRNYPTLLKQVEGPPLLYYRGSLEEINRPAVAVVGSRRCTFYGREVAGRLASELSGAEVSIVSGMALGIDTAAHRGALESCGYTVAVLGCGVDYCYPPGNEELMDQIIASGAVVSEFPPGTKPSASYFPRRNRIISGLSLGTVVVEATAKSGALITANYALEQNREVFAVPGNVGSPYSRGSHRLIKEGARLVETAADILEELYLGPASGCPGEVQLTIEGAALNLTAEEKAVLAVIPYQPLHIDNIIRESGLKASQASALLLSLELKKVIRQTPGKYFTRV